MIDEELSAAPNGGSARLSTRASRSWPPGSRGYSQRTSDHRPYVYTLAPSGRMSASAAGSALLCRFLGDMASAAGGQPEEGQAGWQAMDLHWDRSRGLPVGAAQTEPAGEGRAAAHEVPVDAVVAVAEFAGDTKRGRVVLERRRYRPLGAEPVEGQGQHRCPHLGADPLPLVAAAEPGTGMYLPQHREVE